VPPSGQKNWLNAYRPMLNSHVYLVWRTCSSNVVGHINKIKLRRARLVPGLVTTFGESTIPVIIRPTQPGHPSGGRCNDGFGHHWRRNGEFCVAVGPVTRTAGTLAYCVIAKLCLTFAGSVLFLATGLTVSA